MMGDARAHPSARSAARRSTGTPIALVVLGVLLALAYAAHGVLSGRSTAIAVLLAVQGVVYIGSGALAWRRRPDYLTGRLLVLIGFLSLLNGLIRFEQVGVLWAIGAGYNGLYEAVLAYLILTYPSGRPTRTIWGVAAVGMVVVFPVLTTFRLLTADPVLVCPLANFCLDGPNPFRLWDVGMLGYDILLIATQIAAAVVVVLSVWRYLAARGAARRALLPVLAAGFLIAVTLSAVIVATGGDDDEVTFLVIRGSELLMPIALAVGFLRSRMARAGVADLVTRAGPAPTAAELEGAVQRVLHDPSARVLAWSSGNQGYVDAAGAPTPLPADEAGRPVTLVSAGGRPLAAIEHDPVLAEEVDLVESVAAAVRIVLQNQELATSVRSQAEDLRRLPRGRVTLMYTDVEGSTRLLDDLREAYVDLIGDLRRLLRQATLRADGMEIDSRADEFFAVIPDAERAAAAALEVHAAAAARSWPRGAIVRLRIGLHTGEPALTDEGYVGMDVHCTARVAAAAHGGQTIVSAEARAAIEASAPGAHRFRDLGSYALRGIPQPQRLFQLESPAESAAFPALRAERVPDPS